MAERAQQQQEQAKVLRIGVLHGGKVVQERLVRPGSDVTIGESPRNTFVVTAEGVPKRYVLFHAKGNKYQLAFTEQMDGKVALDSGLATFDDLRKSDQTAKKGDTWTVPISEKSRGKIGFGELTILFQFVPAPPESARLVTATDFRPKLLDDDDPVFLGFLALFTALAAVLLVYVYNTEPPELVTAGEIPDRFVDMIVPDSDPKDAPDEIEPEIDETLEGELVKKETEPKDAGDKKPRDEAEAQAKKAADAQKKRENVLQSSKLLAGLIGTRGENNSGDMVEDLFADGDAQFGDLDKALQEVGGLDIAGSGNLAAQRNGENGGGRGGEDAGIGTMSGGKVGAGGGVGEGPGTKVSGKTDIGPIDAGDAGNADEATKAIRRYRGSVQACYERELSKDPTIRGRLALAIDVSAGKVTNVVVEENGTRNSAVEDCVKRAVRSWRFDGSVDGTVYPTFVLAPSG
ncbi:MAG: AgmX/PglI C-terminal domain-containing protein [Alphaproteobacteria bacterium]|nr:AgmX/PglI C-terminal domain-containing protein [Alphaproteobacteria bacterium]